jgi:hypothetical protein
MESSQYKIQMSTIDIAGGTQSSGGYNLSTSVGQSAAKEFAANGYIVKAGFQYIYSIIPFTFSITNLNIDFGSLIPNTTSTGTSTLKISAGGGYGYQVTAIQEHPLQTLGIGSTIPNTACDVGTPCTITQANPWTSNSTYGLGYNMAGQDIPADFVNSTYYRPFSNESANQTSAVVMSSSKVTMPSGTPTPAPARLRTHESTIQYKVNISSLQLTGNYHTVIKFTATPIY